MDRRSFLKLSGLGGSALFLASPLKAIGLQDTQQATELVEQAIHLAQKMGALYADARLGPCDLQGHGPQFQPFSLFHSDLLGMRICTPKGWKHVVIRNPELPGLEPAIRHAFQSKPVIQREAGYWVSAEFCKEKLLVSQSTDPGIQHRIHSGWMRYADRPPLPKSTADLLYCDLILEQ